MVHLVHSVHLFVSVPRLRWGTHACRGWHTHISRAYFHNWLGCYCCEHPYPADVFTHSRSILWASPYSCLVLSLQDLHTFGWCPCALYSLYKVYIIESVYPQGWHLVAPHSANYTYIIITTIKIPAEPTTTRQLNFVHRDNDYCSKSLVSNCFVCEGCRNVKSYV